MAHSAVIEHKDMTPAGLLALARARADATRREYRVFAAAILGASDAALTDRQRATLSRLLRQLIGEIETAVRGRAHAVLERAGGLDAVPTAGIETSATEPVYAALAAGGALNDSALIEAVVHRLYQHQLERAMHTPARDGWLGDAGQVDPDLGTLLGVPEGVPLRRLIGPYLVDRNRRRDSYGDPVLPARELAGDLRRRLFWDVAAALRDGLPEGSAIDAAVETAAASVLAEHDAQPAGGQALVLAQGLRDGGLLTPEAAIKALRAGEVTLFETILAAFSGLRLTLLRRLVYDTGGEGFAILARAVDLREALFGDIYSLTRHARGRPLADPSAALEALNAFRLAVPVDSARAVLDHWRRSPDYLAARWRLETGSRAAHAEESG